MGLVDYCKNQWDQFRMDIKVDLNDSKIVKTLAGLVGVGCGTASAYNFCKKEASPRAGAVSVIFSAVFFLLYLFMENKDDERKEQEYDQESEKKREEGDNYIRKREADAECYRRKREADAAYYRSKRETDAQYKKDSSQQTIDDDVETQAEGSNVTDSESGINLQGSSSDDLFSRPSTDDDSKWVVCGYMKVGQVNLIVAGGGVGKTIIMVQIALAVAKGTRPEFLPDECCASVKLPVFYYRLEDFSDELAGKYGKGKVFNGSSITWFLPRDLKEFSLNGFIEHLKTLAERLTEDSLVCIDPATKLDGYKHSEFIKGVEDAKAIANERGFVLTPVATIHLDEIEDWKYLSLNNIKGGDKALQLAGSVTAIRRERTDLDHRFLQSLKEPKGSPKPFYGNVLVCKAVEEELDENNRYLHYEFECIKEETLARPEKPKAQADDKEYDSVPPKPSTPPNQKITPEILKIIQEGLRKGMKVKDIAVQIWKRAKVQLNEDYLRKFIKNNFE